MTTKSDISIKQYLLCDNLFNLEDTKFVFFTALLLRGFLVPIINTIFIELSTATYPNISFSPRLILRLNFSFLYNENSQSKPKPQAVPSVDIDHASSSNNRSSENSLNGNKPVFRYRNTR